MQLSHVVRITGLAFLLSGIAISASAADSKPSKSDSGFILGKPQNRTQTTSKFDAGPGGGPHTQPDTGFILGKPQNRTQTTPKFNAGPGGGPHTKSNTDAGPGGGPHTAPDSAVGGGGGPG